MFSNGNLLVSVMDLSKVLLIISLVLTSSLLRAKNITRRNKEQVWGKYDFVIIGGGTAGSVLASRLSEIHKWKILVLEAGKVPSTLTRVPSISPLLQLTPYNWKYLSQASTNGTTFLGLKNGEMLWSSGKGLGGSSIINYMIYSRGNPADFDAWNLKNWTHRQVLPYFLKSERANLDYSDLQCHNTTGPLSIEHSHNSDSTAKFFKAGQELGYKLIDYNGKQQLGFSTIQAFLKKGQRETPFSAYFPNGTTTASNVEFVTEADVTKIALNSNGTTVKSVKFTKNKTKYRVKVNKEAILSAGTFGSPKLLMLSGLGPKDDLAKLGINVLRDLRGVGRNLIDHVTYPALNFITTLENRTHFEMMTNYIVNLPFWYYAGRGVSANLGGFEALAFVNSTKNDSRPDFEILFQTTMMNEGVKKILNLKDEVFNDLYGINDTWMEISFSIYPILLHPKSRGLVKLKSTNPFDPPVLIPNYFSAREDLLNMIKAIDFILKLIETQPFQQAGTHLNPNLVPGCENEDQDYWECALRTLAITANDPCGTNKMGEATDETSVVNANDLLVKGVENLRIVDASVIPGTISGHLAATVVAIAEKAADFIKHSHIHNKS